MSTEFFIGCLVGWCMAEIVKAIFYSLKLRSERL